MQTLQTIDNIRIAYDVYGDDSAPVILLIMGLGMPSKAWPDRLIEQLDRHGLRVVVFDNRDSGESTKIDRYVSPFATFGAIVRTLMRRPVTGCYSLEDMAADAVAVLDELQIKRAHVMGISMGAMIGQVMANMYPQRVSSLISVMGASGNPRTGLGKLRAISGILSKPPRHRDLEAMKKYLRKMFKAIGSPGESYSDQQVTIVAEAMLESGYEQTWSSRQLLAILASGDRSKYLKRIMTPTLVIHGRDDPLLPLRAGEEVARLIPNSRMMVINGMGHDLPDRVIDQIVPAVGKHCHRYKD